MLCAMSLYVCSFFPNDLLPPDLYSLSLHDALPISSSRRFCRLSNSSIIALVPLLVSLRLRDLAPLKGFPPLKALDPLTALYPLSADGSLPTKGSSRQAFRARRETGKPSDFANFLICRRLPQINSPWATNRPTTTTPQCAPKVMA